MDGSFQPVLFRLGSRGEESFVIILLWPHPEAPSISQPEFVSRMIDNCHPCSTRPSPRARRERGRICEGRLSVKASGNKGDRGTNTRRHPPAVRTVLLPCLCQRPSSMRYGSGRTIDGTHHRGPRGERRLRQTGTISTASLRMNWRERPEGGEGRGRSTQRHGRPF